MDIDSYVLEFIKKKRTATNDGRLTEKEEKRIKGIFEDCLDAVLKKYIQEYLPSVVLCNTYNKYSIIMPVRQAKLDYKYYLLYDYHMNVVNRTFDSIYFSETDFGHDVWKFAYGIFAEDAFINNEEILSTYYGLNQVALGPFEYVVPKSIELDFILDIQDRYIIGHEIGHWIFKVFSGSSNDEMFNISFSRDWKGLYEEIGILLQEMYDEYEILYENKEYAALIKEQKDIVVNIEAIWEECFADAIAYAIIYAYIEEEYPRNIEKKILAGQALFLEMMNLQLLAMQQMTVSDESFESSTSIRLVFLRNYSRLYFESEEKLFDEMLEKTAIRYEERITNLMIECFSELEDRADNIYNEILDDRGVANFEHIIGL